MTTEETPKPQTLRDAVRQILAMTITKVAQQACRNGEGDRREWPHIADLEEVDSWRSVGDKYAHQVFPLIEFEFGRAGYFDKNLTQTISDLQDKLKITEVRFVNQKTFFEKELDERNATIHKQDQEIGALRIAIQKLEADKKKSDEEWEGINEGWNRKVREATATANTFEMKKVSLENGLDILRDFLKRKSINLVPDTLSPTMVAHAVLKHIGEERGKADKERERLNQTWTQKVLDLTTQLNALDAKRVPLEKAIDDLADYLMKGKYVRQDAPLTPALVAHGLITHIEEVKGQLDAVSDVEGIYRQNTALREGQTQLKEANKRLSDRVKELEDKAKDDREHWKFLISKKEDVERSLETIAASTGWNPDKLLTPDVWLAGYLVTEKKRVRDYEDKAEARERELQSNLHAAYETIKEKQRLFEERSGEISGLNVRVNEYWKDIQELKRQLAVQVRSSPEDSRLLGALQEKIKEIANEAGWSALPTLSPEDFLSAAVPTLVKIKDRFNDLATNLENAQGKIKDLEERHDRLYKQCREAERALGEEQTRFTDLWDKLAYSAKENGWEGFSSVPGARASMLGFIQDQLMLYRMSKSQFKECQERLKEEESKNIKLGDAYADAYFKIDKLLGVARDAGWLLKPGTQSAWEFLKEALQNKKSHSELHDTIEKIATEYGWTKSVDLPAWEYLRAEVNNLRLVKKSLQEQLSARDTKIGGMQYLIREAARSLQNLVDEK
jgi:translation initiation factor 2B subunit (eIF-2B alpha/beta/delta family)